MLSELPLKIFLMWYHMYKIFIFIIIIIYLVSYNFFSTLTMFGFAFNSFFLFHFSENNNWREIAYTCVRTYTVFPFQIEIFQGIHSHNFSILKQFAAGASIEQWKEKKKTTITWFQVFVKFFHMQTMSLNP